MVHPRCPICDKTFLLKINLVGHLRSVHNALVSGNSAMTILPVTSHVKQGATTGVHFTGLPIPPRSEEAAWHGASENELNRNDTSVECVVGLPSELTSSTEHVKTDDFDCDGAPGTKVTNGHSEAEIFQTATSTISSRSPRKSPPVVPRLNFVTHAVGTHQTEKKRHNRGNYRINKVWGFFYKRGGSAPGQPDRWTCVVCNKGLNTFGALVLHLRKNHGSIINIAVIESNGGNSIGPRVQNPSLVGGPEKRSHIKPWTCRKCSKNFMRHKDLWKHRINFCGLSRYSYKCPCCPAEFKQMSLLYEHRMTHNSRGQLKLKVSKPHDRRPILHGGIVNGSSSNSSGLEFEASTNVEIKTRHMDRRIDNENPQVNVSEQNGGESLGIGEAKGRNDATVLATESAVGSQVTDHINSPASASESIPKICESPVKNKFLVTLNPTSLSGSTRTGLKTLICRECNASLPNGREYVAHLRNHKERKQPARLPSKYSLRTPSKNRRLATEAAAGITKVKNRLQQRKARVPIKRKKKPVVKVEPPEYSCPDCRQEFRKERSFQLHFQQGLCKRSQNLYNCEFCRISFRRETTLRNHIKTQHDASKGNEDCGPTVKMRDEDHDGEGSGGPKQCPVCGKFLQTLRSLNSHVASYHAVKTLPATPKRQKRNPSGNQSRSVQSYRSPSFEENSGVGRSVVPRTEEGGGFPEIPEYSLSPSHQKPYWADFVCNDCGKNFERKFDLVEHLLWHNDMKRPPQMFRGRRKTGNSQVEDEDQAVHKCAICGGGFNRREDMLSHVRFRHSRKGNYGCMKCERVFQNALALTEHQSLHRLILEPNRKLNITRDEVANRSDSSQCFPCIYCGDKFSSLKLLHQHRKRTHPLETSLICPYPNCCIPYVHELGLKRHMRDHHL